MSYKRNSRTRNQETTRIQKTEAVLFEFREGGSFMIQGYWCLIPHLAWRCNSFDSDVVMIKGGGAAPLMFPHLPLISIRKKGTMVPTVNNACGNVRFWPFGASYVEVFSIVRITCKLLMLCSFSIFGMGTKACVFWHLLACVWSMICSLFLVLPRRLGGNSCRQHDPWELWKVSWERLFIGHAKCWMPWDSRYATYIIIHIQIHMIHRHCFPFGMIDIITARCLHKLGYSILWLHARKFPRKLQWMMVGSWKANAALQQNHGEFSMDPHLPLWLLETFNTTGHI